MEIRRSEVTTLLTNKANKTILNFWLRTLRFSNPIYDLKWLSQEVGINYRTLMYIYSSMFKTIETTKTLKNGKTKTTYKFIKDKNYRETFRIVFYPIFSFSGRGVEFPKRIKKDGRGFYIHVEESIVNKLIKLLNCGNGGVLAVRVWLYILLANHQTKPFHKLSARVLAYAIFNYQHPQYDKEGVEINLGNKKYKEPKYGRPSEVTDSDIRKIRSALKLLEEGGLLNSEKTWKKLGRQGPNIRTAITENKAECKSEQDGHPYVNEKGTLNMNKMGTPYVNNLGTLNVNKMGTPIYISRFILVGL